MQQLLVSLTLSTLLAGVAHAGSSALEPFATVIKDKYKDRPDVVKTQTEWVAAAAAQFEQVWAKYAARKKEVDAAIAKAEELSAANKHAEARAVLDAVITPIPPDETGKLPKQRAFLEPRDAELPALAAIGRVAIAQKDHARLVTLAADLWVRRRVLDVETERQWWITSTERTKVSNLAAGHTQDVAKQFAQLDACVQESTGGGEVLATAHLEGLREHGIGSGSVSFHKPANTKGDLVLIELTPTKLDDKTLTFKKTDLWTEYYDCKTTTEVAAVDPLTGRVRFKENCKSRNKSQPLSLTATLVEPPPAWAAKPRTKLTLLAKVIKPGPAWDLKDARVIDTRFTAHRSYIAPRTRCEALAPKP